MLENEKFKIVFHFFLRLAKIEVCFFVGANNLYRKKHIKQDELIEKDLKYLFEPTCLLIVGVDDPLWAGKSIFDNKIFEKLVCFR